MIAGCAALPISLLLFLFVRHVWGDIHFAQRELAGAPAVERAWRELAAGDAKNAWAKATEIRSLADQSNLSLDTELDSYYAQEALCLDLPRLMAAADTLADGPPPDQLSKAREDVEAAADSSAQDLEKAIQSDASGRAREALAGPLKALAAAVAQTRSGPASAAAPAAHQLRQAVGAVWAEDGGQLIRILQARIGRMQRDLALELGFVAMALGLAGLLMIATARGLTDRLAGLLATIDRLNAGDTSAAPPFLADRHETGRIAETLAAFREGLIEARESDRRLRSLNWALTAYGRATSALLHAEDLASVASGFCEALVQDDAYVLVAVALAEPPPSQAVKVVAGAGRALDYLTDLRLSWSESVAEGQGPTGLAIRSGEPVMLRDVLEDPSFGPWRQNAQRFGIRSSVTVPFKSADAILGVLIVYTDQPDAFGRQEMDLFRRLAEELAFAITLEEDRKRLAASRQAQKLAEDAELLSRQRLEESEARYRLLAEEASDIILHYDRDGLIEYVSPSVRQLGYTPEEWIGQPLSTFGHPDDQARRREVRGLLFDNQSLPANTRNESRVRRADGVWVWAEGRPSVVRDAAGKAISIITILRDVTERHQMEEELRRKRVEAEAAAFAKAQFLANMSHEIRTPLTGVIGFAGLLDRSQALPERERGHVKRIVSAGQALLSLVDDILDVSRIEAGRVTLSPAPVDLEAFLSDSLELVRHEAGRKGLALSFETAESTPPVFSLDAGRVRQVLLNLVGNAIKFTDEGRISVAVSYWAAGGGFLRFAVSDTGVGVAAADIGRLFQRFSQADESDTRRHGGAGLGLAISKGLVERMGGEIGVESELGRGSTFWFTLSAPIAEPLAIPDAEDEHAEPVLAPMRILIVDDVDVNRELIATMLSPFDLELVQASNGAEAVTATDRSQFDLILMDLQMPVMDGLAATRAIRTRSVRNRATPILAVSANVLPDQVAACKRAGMNDHIAKPIDPQTLLDKIDRWTTPTEEADP